MSSMLLTHQDYNNLSCALKSIAFSGNLHSGYCLKALLSDFSRLGYPDDGANNIARLLYVANYRAFLVRYEGRHLNDVKFESLKKHLTRPKPTNYALENDFALLVQTYKFVQSAIYQCAEDGDRVKCSDRVMWTKFTKLKEVLAAVMIDNMPEYQTAKWADMPLTWVKRYA